MWGWRSIPTVNELACPLSGTCHYDGHRWHLVLQMSQALSLLLTIPLLVTCAVVCRGSKVVSIDCLSLSLSYLCKQLTGSFWPCSVALMFTNCCTVIWQEERTLLFSTWTWALHTSVCSACLPLAVCATEQVGIVLFMVSCTGGQWTLYQQPYSHSRVYRPWANPQIKYGPTCHQWYHADVTNVFTLVRLSPHRLCVADILT